MSSKKVIFAVDDESYMVRSYREVFQDDYDLHFFDSSEEVLKTLDTIKPDLVIIDIGLDEMDGYELCEELKKKEGLEDIPVVFVTGHDFSEDQGRAFFSGGAEYVMKPIDADKIRHLITKLLQTHSLS